MNLSYAALRIGRRYIEKLKFFIVPLKVLGLNFFIVGFQDWLFDAARTGRRGRIYLDVTGPVTRDGLIITKEISAEAAEAKFQNRHITEFPLAPALHADLAA